MWIWVEKEHLGHKQKVENKGAACASEVAGSPDALSSRSSCCPGEFDIDSTVPQYNVRIFLE